MGAPEKGGTREVVSLVYSVGRNCGLVICAFMDISSKQPPWVGSWTKMAPLERDSLMAHLLSGLCLSCKEKGVLFPRSHHASQISAPSATLFCCLHAVGGLPTGMWRSGIRKDLPEKRFICVRLLGVVL